MAGTRGIFIIGAKRSPFCGHGGPLRELPAYYIFAAAAKEAIQSANIEPTLIDNTVIGNVNFLSQCDGGKTPRYCGLFSGVPINRPALGVNKTCGTGLQAIISSSVDILTGNSKVTLTGGTELMSTLPLLVRNIRFGATLGSSYYMEDHIKRLFPDSYTGLTIQAMAENLAKKYEITREDADNFALQSRLKWRAAQNSKVFDRELTSLTVIVKDKEVTIDTDQLPQTEVTAEALRQLPALLDNGEVITTGNSYAPADGAAAMIISGEEMVKSQNLLPLARVAGWACVGVDPIETGVAAVPAVRKLLKDQRLTVNDVDLFEINETFACQALAIAKELSVDLRKVNVSGGALAVGHPVAATGARMATHLAHQLSHQNLKRGIATSSCGGGQGIAILLEKV